MSAPAALGGPHALWYATRGTGIVALLLLTAITCLGVAGARRMGGDRWPRFVVAGLHRNLTLLALVFLALHIATTVLDGYAPIRLSDALLPFAAGYRPLWLGLGTVAFDLLLALTITSLLRPHLGYRAWRALHWAAYAAWPVALVHALGTGSDARSGWMRALGAATGAAVLLAAAARLGGGTAQRGRRALGVALVVVAPIAVAAWYAAGPARPGWGRHAATPARPVPAPTPRALTRSALPPPASLPSAPFAAALRGRLVTSQRPDGSVLVDIRGRTRAPASGVLWIRLEGLPADGGGVTMRASGASYGPPSVPAEYVGTITSLDGTRLVLALRGPHERLAVRVTLRIDGATRRVTGTVAARPAKAPAP